MTVDDVRLLGDRNVLALTMDGEAESEPVEGQIAVGSVIRSRLADPVRFGATITDVCLKYEQFSCWLPGPDCTRILAKAAAIESGQTPTDPAFRQLLWLASGILSGDLLDNVAGATHYVTSALYASSSAPSWVRQARVLARKGTQVFMKA